MGIEALYRKPNTSKRHPAHTIYPYLLRGLAIERANQVWAMDITYIPMARGFVYLAAIIDWHSREVLALAACRSRWTPTSACEALEEALARYGKPEIFNTDQGSQFTSLEFTERLQGPTASPSAWTAGLLARQRVRRAAVAQREVRRGVPASLRDRQPGHAKASRAT